MDPLSVSASIVALLQLSSKIIGYLSDVKGAPKEHQRLRFEVCSVLPILSILQDQAEQQGDSWSNTLQTLNGPQGPLEQFRKSLERLASKLAPVKGLKKAGKAIVWPFEKGEVQNILSTIERQKSLFNLARQNDHIALSKAIKGDVNNLHTRVDEISEGIFDLRVSEQQARIHRWLGAPDPSSNYNKAVETHLDKTGDWFIQSHIYSDWLSKSNSLIWLYGIPGCGKTILSSTIVQNTLRYRHPGSEVAVLYFFFDFNDTSKQRHKLMIRSLVSQLSTQCASASAPLDKLYAFCNNGAQQPNSEGLMQTLREMLGTVHDSFIILDALDECVDRRELLAIIEEILSWNDTKCHIIATSRKERDIEDVLQTIAMNEGSICIQSENVDNDIRGYVRHRLQTDPKLKRWQREQQNIEDALMQKAAGIYVEFRWAVCQLDELGSCRSLAQLRKALQALPKTLDETYDRILCKIEGDDRAYAFRILQWLAFSAEPLTLEQLVEVIAIDISGTPQFDIEKRFEDPLDVLEICSSLLTVYNRYYFEDEQGVMRPADKIGESSNNFVRLAHLSVKEYLISDRIRGGPAAKYYIQEIPSHMALTKDCIAYLLQVNDLNTSAEELVKEYPLLEYAEKRWTQHAAPAEESTGFAIDSIQEFFREKEKPFRQWPWIHHRGGVSTPLYYASATGLIETIKLLIENGAQIDAYGGNFGGPLQIAACEGRIPVVKLLLDYGANANIENQGCGGTALETASWQGHVEIVRLILDREADTNDIEGRYSRALDLAAYNCKTEIVQLLLDRGADVNVNFEPGFLEGVIDAVVCFKKKEQYKILGMLLDAGIRVQADVIWRVEQSGDKTLAKMFTERGFSITVKSPSDQEQ